MNQVEISVTIEVSARYVLGGNGSPGPGSESSLTITEDQVPEGGRDSPVDEVHKPVTVEVSRHDAASADYKQTVLTAMRQVEDALSNLEILKRQVAAQQTTVASGTEALELSRKRYSAGLVAYYEVLDGQRTLLNAEQEATRLRGEQQLMSVLLIKALGGGW